MPLRNQLLVYSLFLFSGATALIYQVAWARSLILIFGATTQAVSIVLGSFMAGLALGGWYFGRRSQGLHRPLRFYGYLEIGVAVFALLLPLLLSLVDQLYVNFASGTAGVTWQLTLMRVVLAFAVLVLPTFFMGGTLPILTRYLVHQYGQMPVGLSTLYAINTLGAVLGTLAAGFFLLRWLGVWNTQLVAVVANVIIGVVAIVADRGVATIRTAPASAPTAAPISDAITRRDVRYRPALFAAFVGTFFCGLSALGLEVMWTRAIAVSTGTTTYSFTIMLAAFLTGIALGSWLHALIPLRRIHETVQFGVIVFLIGVSSLVVSQLMPHLPRFAVAVNHALYGPTPRVERGTTLVLSFLMMLVPCLFMGAAFPLAGQARARLVERFGQAVGDTASFNTVGAIIGAMLAGFVLIPVFGLQRGMLALCAVLIGYGVLVLALAGAARWPAARPVMWLLALLGVAGAAAIVPAIPPWDSRVLATFQNNDTSVYTDARGRLDENRLRDVKVLLYREGRGANVSVLETSGTRALVINGDAVATEGLSDLHHEFMLGHVPVLVHPDPRSAIVIGLGAGITLGGVAAHGSFEEITVVEIEPAVVEAAAFFAQSHDDALNDPRVRMIVQDGRNYLRTINATYDVITADPIHPWSRGSAYLFTKDYYELCSRRLNPGGIMCQWLPLYELTQNNVKSVIASFAAVFPHTTIWQATADIILIGSDRPISLDMDNLARRLAEPKVARQLGRIGLGDPLSFLSEFAVDENSVRKLVTGAIVNTDDNLYLEFSAPLSIAAEVMSGNLAMIEANRHNPATIVGRLDPVFTSEAQATDRLAAFAQLKSETVTAGVQWLAVSHAASIPAMTQVIDRMRALHQRLPEYAHARFVLSGFLSALAQLTQSQDQGAAIRLLHEAAEVFPANAEAQFVLGTLLAERGAAVEAVAALELAVNLQPRNLAARRNLAVVLSQLGRHADAATHFAVWAELDPDNVEARFGLGLAQLQSGNVKDAVEQFKQVIAQQPTFVRAYEAMALALRLARQPQDALRVLRAGVQANPNDVGLNLSLAWMLATSADENLRNGPHAVQLAERVVQGLQNPPPMALDVLAAGLAEVGRYSDAADLAGRAIQLAERQGQADAANAMRQRQEMYRNNQPFRE